MSSPKAVTFPAEQATLSLTNPRGKTAVMVRVPGLGGLDFCTAICRDEGQHPAQTPQPPPPALFANPQVPLYP